MLGLAGMLMTPLAAGQEEDMGRKMQVVEAQLGAGDGVVALSREGLSLAPPGPMREQVIFTGSSDWTPDQAEHYIDRRIQLLDLEIARVREQLDGLLVSRKRWLAVTGGRSKMSANGNGHAAVSGA